MTKKEYQVIYKFSDVINTFEAENQEEAEKFANDLLEKNEQQGSSECYEIEVEEIKD